MKIGSKTWLKRERDWLMSDIDFTVHLISSLKNNPLIPANIISNETSILYRLRRELKLLRDNPKAYERKKKKELS